MKTVLSIAGSDSCGGAGIQADIKTMIMNGVYAMTAITALTAQNTTGVFGVLEATPEFLAKQIDAVFTDIYPDAVKIGMISSSALVEVIAERLSFYKAKHIVVDPVMVATSGATLTKRNATNVIIEKLFPLAEVITPNIPEAEILSGCTIQNKDDMTKAAKVIGDTCKCAVLLKGGHNKNDANDVLYNHGSFEWFNSERIINSNTHGTGCTLSSAIAANLAKGLNLVDSIKKAKGYISNCLKSNLDLGKGSGPLNHGFKISE